MKFLNRMKTWKNTSSSLHLYKQAIAVLVSSLLGFSVGITVGITATLLPQLEENDQFYWTKEFSSWMASLAPITSIFSCLCIGRLLVRFGRKTAHMILTFPYIIGYLCMAFANNFLVMMIGRFFTGIAYGATKSTAIIYLGEISDPKFRGVLLIFPSLAGNSGVLFTHIVGTFVIWRLALLISILPNIVMFVLYWYIKESPYWLISKDRTVEGIESFKWYRGTEEHAESELRDVLDRQKSKGTSLTSKELFKIVCSRSFIKPTVTMFFVFVAVQLNGVNCFPYYANDLIQAMFNDKIDTFLVMTIIDIIRVGSSLVICLIGKNMPRRVSFLYCAYATVLLLIGLAVTRYYGSSVISKWLPLTLVLFYTTVASVLSSIGWTFIAEIYPTNVRGLGSGLSGAISYIMLSLSVKITPDLLAYGEPVMYGGFATVTVISAIILHFILPETHGKTLQDIEDNYNDRDERRKEITTL